MLGYPAISYTQNTTVLPAHAPRKHVLISIVIWNFILRQLQRATILLVYVGVHVHAVQASYRTIVYFLLISDYLTKSWLKETDSSQDVPNCMVPTHERADRELRLHVVPLSHVRVLYLHY